MTMEVFGLHSRSLTLGSLGAFSTYLASAHICLGLTGLVGTGATLYIHTYMCLDQSKPQSGLTKQITSTII